MIKQCRFCGKEFETLKHGGNRQFCFDCVPDGLTISERTAYKRRAAKRAGVALLGGKCLKCGESRPYILAFHHLDKTQKDDTPSRFIANSQFELYFEEIKKCCLLCSNCHNEFHFFEINENMDIETYLGQTIQEIEQQNEQSDISRKYSVKPIIEKKCSVCGRTLAPNSKSEKCHDCAVVQTRKVINRPSKEELFNYLIEIRGNFTKAGQHFNVTDNAVRKWCRTYQLPYHSSDYK